MHVAPQPEPPLDTLPTLIDRAAAALTGARTSAEVLEAREMAGAAFDLARRTARLLRAEAAHNELMAAAQRAMADALVIEHQAKARLSEEYDAAQKSGAVRGEGRPKTARSGGSFVPSAKDIGLSSQMLSEGRQLRNVEQADPGFIERVIEDRLAAGQAPTRAAVRAAVRQATFKPAVKPRDIVKTPTPLVTKERAAELLDVSVAAMEEAKNIIERGSPDLVEAVETGGIDLKTVTQVLELPMPDQRRTTRALPSLPMGKPDPYIKGDTGVFHLVEDTLKAIERLGEARGAMRRFSPQLAHTVSVAMLERVARWFDDAADEWHLIQEDAHVAAA